MVSKAKQAPILVCLQPGLCDVCCRSRIQTAAGMYQPSCDGVALIETGFCVKAAGFSCAARKPVSTLCIAHVLIQQMGFHCKGADD